MAAMGAGYKRPAEYQRTDVQIARLRRRAALRKLPKPLLPDGDFEVASVVGTAILTESALLHMNDEGLLQVLTPIFRGSTPAQFDGPTPAFSAEGSRCPCGPPVSARWPTATLALASVEMQLPSSQQQHHHDKESDVGRALRSLFTSPPRAETLVFPTHPGGIPQAVALTRREFVRNGTPAPPPHVAVPRVVAEGGHIILSDPLMHAKVVGLGAGESASSALPGDVVQEVPEWCSPRSSGLRPRTTVAAASPPLPALHPTDLQRHLSEVDSRVRPTFRLRGAEEVYGTASYLKS